MAREEQASQRPIAIRPDSQSPVTPSLSSSSRKRGSDSITDSRQKSKVTRACDICKAKKSKCSGEQPCETCNRRGLNCQYEAFYSRGKAPTPRQNPSASGNSTLQPAFPHSILSTTEVSESNSSTSYQRQDTSRTLHRPDMNVVVNVDNDLIQEAPSRGSPGLEVAGQYSDTTSGLSFLHRAWRRISNGTQSQLMNGGQLGTTEDNQLLARAGDKPFQKPGVLQIPTLDRGKELLALYFEVCIATYRLLHRPTVESWFKIVSQNFLSRQPLHTNLGNARTAIVLTVLSVACIHEEKARGDTNPITTHGDAAHLQSDELFSEALNLVDNETGFPKLESAQARLIQVLYLLMSSRFNQAWYAFGHSFQVISALGLHRREDRKRPSPGHRRDYIEDQCKKRTFWVAYTLDKYLGTIFGRPRHYHDDDIDQDFPDTVNDEDMTSMGPIDGGIDDCHIESLVYHAKLAQIAEKISREVYSIKPVPDNERLAASHRLGEDLRQWRNSLPPFLGAVNPSSLIHSLRRQAMALRMSYSHAVMLAHRPFLLKNTARHSESTRQLARESITECIKAARSVLESVDRMAHEGRLFHAFWWTHYVCFCALVVIYVWAIQESNVAISERRKILDQAERCLSHIAQATATNSPSRKYSIILQELRAEAKRKTARAIQEHAQANNTISMLEDRSLDMDATLSQEQHMEDAVAALFGSPIDTTTPGLQNFLDDWQTTDWLDLDSSAFASLPVYGTAPLNWMEDE